MTSGKNRLRQNTAILRACCQVLILVSLVAVPPMSPASEFPVADKVVVEKEKRKLHLIKNDEIFRTFDIALGITPVGGKEKEGDFKTPEGSYTLDTRNPDSDFFLSIHV